MIVKKIFYKTTIYIIVLNIFIITALFVSVSAAFWGGAGKPNKNINNDYLNVPNFSYFKYKKYANDLIVKKNDIILSSENILYYANRDLAPSEIYQNYNNLFPGNYRLTPVRKQMNYFQLGNDFYPRNIYRANDYIYHHATKKIYRRKNNYYPNVEFNTIINKNDAPGKSERWEVVENINVAIWKRYNLYRKYDIAFWGNKFWFVYKDYSVTGQDGAKPGNYTDSNWREVENVKNILYPKYSIVKTSDDKFYQARFNNCDGSDLLNTRLWQEVYPRI